MNKEREKLLCIDAPAKINLYLHITGKRTDGLHELESLIVFAETCDVISFRPSKTLSLEISGPQANQLKEQDSKNIILKAVESMSSLIDSNVDVGVEIHLQKFLPIAAGIGGGSADAAATLRALKILWNVSLSDNQLMNLAYSLGSDVPVCILGTSAYLAGVGEKVTPVESIPKIPLLLVNPKIPLPTSLVFNSWKGSNSTLNPIVSFSGSVSKLVAELRDRRNDLEDPARSLVPQIDEVICEIQSQRGCELARMSGSGATCFGIFLKQEDLTIAASRIKMSHPNWWVMETFSR